MKRTIYGILLIFGMLAIASCGGREWAGILDEVESVIQERPDSALQRLRTLNPAQLGTKSQRARYSLLHAMALDKNYIDTTDVSVVMPAVEYYRKHGTADQKMKAWYYLGRIQFNRGDYNAAAVTFSLCKKQLSTTKDLRMKDQLYMALSDEYNDAKKIYIISDGVKYPLDSLDRIIYHSTHGDPVLPISSSKIGFVRNAVFHSWYRQFSEADIQYAGYLSLFVIDPLELKTCDTCKI